ncbi:MAG TPA: hypothetical protein VFP73_09130 [Terrabacter sp.]|nr:hypothetical protein [Terrabacter sp.]
MSTDQQTAAEAGSATTAPTQPVRSTKDVAALEAEVERLRRRNAELESPRSVRVRHAVRSTFVVILTIIAALCLTLAVPAVWARNQVLDTDRYVATMQPLASNADVQASVEAAVNREIAARVDIPALVGQTLPPELARLKAPIESAASGLIGTVVHKAVTSDAFVSLWTNVNRSAHASLVGILTGQTQGQVVTASGNTLSLDLGPVVEQVKTRLVAAGLGVAASIPTVNTSIQIAQLQGLERTQQLVRWLDTTADWLPWIGLLALAGAVALAKGRRLKTLMWGALGTAIGLLVLRIGLVFGREIYLTRMQSTNMSQQTASYLFDTVTRYLVDGIRLVFIVSLVVAGLAILLGRRDALARGGRWVSRTSRNAWDALDEGSVGETVRRHTPVAAGVVVAVGTLVLVIWSNPTGLVVLVTAIVVALLLVAVWAMAHRKVDAGLPAG